MVTWHTAVYLHVLSYVCTWYELVHVVCIVCTCLHTLSVFVDHVSYIPGMLICVRMRSVGMIYRRMLCRCTLCTLHVDCCLLCALYAAYRDSSCVRRVPQPHHTSILTTTRTANSQLLHSTSSYPTLIPSDHTPCRHVGETRHVSLPLRRLAPSDLRSATSGLDLSPIN